MEVNDTGIGIREEEIPKIFMPYQRIDLEKNHSIEGTGLGMGITVQLLRLMDSELHVESEYGVGSTFYFDLKQVIIDDTPMGKLELIADKRADEYNYEALLRLRTRKFLLWMIMKSIVKLLRIFLKKPEYRYLKQTAEQNVSNS